MRDDLVVVESQSVHSLNIGQAQLLGAVLIRLPSRVLVAKLVSLRAIGIIEPECNSGLHDWIPEAVEFALNRLDVKERAAVPVSVVVGSRNLVPLF